MTIHILDKSQSANVKSFNDKIANLDPTIKHKITIKPFIETRTQLQNNLSFAWYEELARNLKEDTAEDYRCFCKLHFGVGILRHDDEEFRKTYDNVIKPLDYEKKLELMKYIPVTSLMNTKQLSLYLEQMKEYFYTNHGYDLLFPSGY